MSQQVEVARRFLAAVGTVISAADRFAKVQEVTDELYRHVPLPMPSFLAAAHVSVRCSWVPPLELRQLLSIDRVVEVEARAIDGRIELTLKGEGGRYSRLVLAGKTAWLYLLTAALVYDHLQREVDILVQLEERLGRPGFFEELRLLLQALATVVSSFLSGASRQAAPGGVERVDEALVRELAAAMDVEARAERKAGLGWGLNRMINIYLPAPIREEVRIAVEPPLLLPPLDEQLLDERLPQSIEELVVRAEEVGRLGRLAVYVRGRGGEVKLLLNWLGDAAAAAVLWDLLRQQGIDFLYILRRRIEEAVERLSLLKDAKEISELFGVIPDG